MAAFKFVNFLWDDAKASLLDPLGRLVYRSNLLGGDQRITNSGGGNTSAKLMETDPLNERRVEVLWVKGSGGDLRTAARENFSSLYQDKLTALKRTYTSRSDRGLKSTAEDELVAMYDHATFNLNPRAPSIDTPLHSFLPGRYVDHMHPNAIISIAASADCKRLVQKIFDGQMASSPGLMTTRNATASRLASSRGPPPTSRNNMPQRAAMRPPSAAPSMPRWRRTGGRLSCRRFSPGCAGSSRATGALSGRFSPTPAS
jgi:hypothetical protein